MMLHSIFRQSVFAAGKYSAAIALLLTTLLSITLSAQAQDQDALKILKKMTDYVSSQKVISATYATDIEVITNDLQKIQFASSGEMLLSRPDKVRAMRKGGYADVELVFDGKTLSVLGKNVNAYAQTDAAGTINQLVDAAAKPVWRGNPRRRFDDV